MHTFRLSSFVQRLRRMHGVWLRALVWAALLLVAATIGGTIQAQEPEQGARAGIVIDFGDGVVHTACVDLGADGQATGEEVLAAAGFDILIEYSPMGGAVCKIGPQGCNFPGQPCWCECMSSPCVYWSYNHLQNGQWLYSTVGASIHMVRAGDVEGWAWGAGTVAQGAAPPVRTFEQICAPPTATPTWTPWPTNTPLPTATWTPLPTNTPPPTPTWTPWPTNTPPPTPTWTPWPTDTPPPTPTWTPIPALPAAGALPNDTPTATPAPVEAATASATPTTESALLPSAQTPDLALPEPSVEDVLLATTEPLADDLPAAQALAQAAAADTPTPTATPQAVAVVAPAAARPSVYRISDPALPPRLDPAAGNAPVRPADAALLTTSRPDYAPLALLIVTLTAAFSLGRAVRRGNLLARVRSGGFSRPVTPETAEAVTAMGAAGSGGFSRPPARRAVVRLLSCAIYGLTAGIGLLALLHPFVTAALIPQSDAASPVSTPLLMTALVALCFLALLFEVQGQTVSAKLIALLGVLVAINSVLRFVEVSIPGPGGFTPVFFLIVLTGYVYGARFGFLMGALTLLVSALITGGIGPWLPGQMFTAGWMGLLAPLALPLVRLAGGRAGSRRELAVLAAFAGLAGLFYGVVINLWFWPFMIGPAEQYWQAGVTLAETMQRYAVYYLATSLLWDAFAVAGNVALVLAFGAATLRALRRFQQRFSFEYEPENAPAQAAPATPVPAKRPALAPSRFSSNTAGSRRDPRPGLADLAGRSHCCAFVDPQSLLPAADPGLSHRG
jgi:energy-coupling factor transport system substrate-specific component